MVRLSTTLAQTIYSGTVSVYLGGLVVNLYGCQPRTQMFSSYTSLNQTTLYTYNDEGFITSMEGKYPNLFTYEYNHTSIGPLILKQIQNLTANPVRQVTSFLYQNQMLARSSIFQIFSNGTGRNLMDEEYFYQSAVLPDYVTVIRAQVLGQGFQYNVSYTLNPQNGLIASIEYILNSPPDVEILHFTYSSDNYLSGLSINDFFYGTYNFTYDEQKRLSSMTCVSDVPYNSSCIYHFNYTKSGDISSIAIGEGTLFDFFCCTGNYFFDIE